MTCETKQRFQTVNQVLSLAAVRAERARIPADMHHDDDDARELARAVADLNDEMAGIG
jgi:hypothetical protein